MDYFNTHDLALKLYRKMPMWDNISQVSIEGNKGEFGSVDFKFSDELVSLKVFVSDKDQMLKVAQKVVDNFSEIITDIYNNSD